MPPSLDEAVAAAKAGDVLKALTLFVDIYGTEDAPVLPTPKSIGALSYFGLSIALVRKQYKPAIDLCRRAVELEFYNGDHYANLARVYIAAGNRKKALDTVEQGLKLSPGHQYLTDVRRSMGVRDRPAVPFLPRENPLNVSLGQARHAKKIAKTEKKKR